MLAYVFVHRPTAAVEIDEYAARLAVFHRALARACPAGFVTSWVWQLQTGPLGEAFENWYLLRDRTALGTLNHAAINGGVRTPHNAIAPLAGAGAGAIYALAHGEPDTAARFRTRVSKPAGMSYQDVHRDPQRAAGTEGALWQRQMVLGPDAEVLLDTPAPPPISDLSAEVTALNPIALLGPDVARPPETS